MRAWARSPRWSFHNQAYVVYAFRQTRHFSTFTARTGGLAGASASCGRHIALIGWVSMSLWQIHGRLPANTHTHTHTCRAVYGKIKQWYMHLQRINTFLLHMHTHEGSEGTLVSQSYMKSQECSKKVRGGRRRERCGERDTKEFKSGWQEKQEQRGGQRGGVWAQMESYESIKVSWCDATRQSLLSFNHLSIPSSFLALPCFNAIL